MYQSIKEFGGESKLEMALALGTAGYKVFPIDQHKKPLIKGWPSKATIDSEQIAKWFDRPDPPNIGVVTGHQAGPHGLLCLDVDGPEGLASLARFEEKHGELARVCVAETPSGGLHIFFQMESDFDIRNSVCKVGPGLDIRANGGYVVVAPSLVFNRQGQLASYKWVTELTLTEGQLPKAPKWLIKLVTATNPPSSLNQKATATAYGQKALDDECQAVALAPVGTRNDTLNRAAFSIFQLVGGGVIEAHEAEQRLRESARICGLSEREIEATLKSAKNKAVLKPRFTPKTKLTALPPTVSLGQVDPRSAPLEVFPPKIQKMLKEAAVAFKDLPLEVAIVALLSVLSASIGQSRVLVVKDNWEEAGNLYLALVAISGLGKSPCFKSFLRPIWKSEVRNKEIWDVEMAAYNAIMDERRQSKERQVLPDPPPRPIRTQHIIEDATTEAIGSILAENPRGLLWYGDELSSIILNLDRYSGTKGGTKARLLSTYDRSPWKTSRRDHEKEQVIESAALSIVGTVQPKVLKELFGQSDALSGFLPRFIFIIAKREAPGLLNNEIFTGQEILEKIAHHLLSWDMDKSNGPPVPRKIKISLAAYELYENWHNKIIREAWNASEIDNVIASKLVTQVLRLALLLHSLQAALDENDGLADLQASTMEGAITLGWWIRDHQRRIWKALGIESEDIKSPLEQAIMKITLNSELDLAANQWRMLNDDFNRLVTQAFGQAIDLGQLGREAVRLGIGQCLMGKKRGKQFSPELIEAFKQKMFI